MLCGQELEIVLKVCLFHKWISQILIGKNGKRLKASKYFNQKWNGKVLIFQPYHLLEVMRALKKDSYEIPAYSGTAKKTMSGYTTLAEAKKK
jgi:hypothetical protein